MTVRDGLVAALAHEIARRVDNARSVAASRRGIAELAVDFLQGDRLVNDLDVGPFDPDELVHWAECYGHPEGWTKRAQAAHGRAEDAELQVRELRAAVWGALVHFNEGRDAQGLSLLNSAIPDGYRPA